MKKENQAHKIEHWKVISAGLVVYDIIAVYLAYFLALWLRFDCRYSMIPAVYLKAFFKFIPIYAVIVILVFKFLRLYNSIWRFASYSELIRCVIATGITFVLHILGIIILFRVMPISYFIFGSLFQFVFTLGVRFSYRFILLERSRIRKETQKAKIKRVMLIGAGETGQIILKDIQRSKSTKDEVACIIDDNPNKWGRYVLGVPVEGGRDSILPCVEKYGIEKIYLTIPSADAKEKRDILNICKETGCELRNLPSVYQLMNGELTVGALRKVAVEDLLGRDPIKVNMDEIYRYIRGKVVMITGGGGSIGSELARQVAKQEPKQLILFDVYENSVYDIQNELKNKYPDLDLQVLIGSVRDSRRMVSVFTTFHPEIVYHAAAHKHVPLMEGSPCEAIKNNAMGTYKTAYAAMMSGCKRFVLISTDKAVNPTNIMGASKRLCEMIIQSFDRMIKEGTPQKIPILGSHKEKYMEAFKERLGHPEEIKTEFVAVRFGNVLGSNGSVIPLFKRQIEQGGPVTVTHPDIIRYFMTIPEAVSLVMQAGTYAKGGEIFVLDMGDPVKIDSLARNLIKLSGLRPDEDIKIEYSGLRPGEKLYEEKLMSEEGMKKTPNDKIHIGSPIPFEAEEFFAQLGGLIDAAYENVPDIRERVCKVVTTFHPSGEHGSEEKGATYEALLHHEDH